MFISHLHSVWQLEIEIWIKLEYSSYDAIDKISFKSYLNFFEIEIAPINPLQKKL